MFRRQSAGSDLALIREENKGRGCSEGELQTTGATTVRQEGNHSGREVALLRWKDHFTNKTFRRASPAVSHDDSQIGKS